MDNVYESLGDNGFWTALSALSKKARCPIFLTSNTYPKQLNSFHAYFRRILTSRPSARECATRIIDIIQQEGFSVRDSSKATENQLVSIAEFCGCDLRRIVHELQLLAHSESSSQEPECESSDQPMECGTVANTQCLAYPTITEISPSRVAAQECSLVTIKGKHFNRLVTCRDQASGEQPVLVHIGSQVCPNACIADDETIFAVCPPAYRAGDVDKFGLKLNKKTGIRMTSLNAIYAPVRVQAVQSSSGRPTLIESTPIVSQTLFDDSTLPVVSSRNIEYLFPERAPNVVNGRTTEEKQDTSDDEAEFEFDSVASHVHLSGSSTSDVSFLEQRMREFLPLANDDAILESSNRLLEKRLEERKTANDNTSTTAIPRNVGIVDQGLEATLESLAADCQLASDAALLESYGSLPYLSGATPGFGFDFTPEGNANSDSSSKLTRDNNAAQ